MTISMYPAGRTEAYMNPFSQAMGRCGGAPCP
nr:MAG TPA: Putative RNase-like toxin [Caudoviricetes sp.]